MKKDVQPKYRRILVKLSGEALGGEAGIGIHAGSVQSMAEQVREVRDLGVQVVICLLYTSPSPRDGLLSRMPSSA